MIMSNYYPVLIPTLCRVEHFKKCVQSLSACTHADKTELYIALDYPLIDNHWDGYNKILSFINEIHGFKDVTIIKREKNYGPEQNIIKAVTVILEKYDAYILSEDDNEFSPNFLEYMNKCLDLYREDARVYAVCGYNFPVDFSSYGNNIYFNHLYSAWGVGRWREKTIPYNITTVRSILGSLRQIVRIYYFNPKYLLSLLRMARENKLYADLLVCAYSIANKKLNVFPTVSKVRNLGHDGSGQHSTKAGRDTYEKQIVDNAFSFDVDEVEVERLRYKKMDKYLDISVGQKIKLIAKLFIYWIRH